MKKFPGAFQTTPKSHRFKLAWTSDSSSGGIFLNRFRYVAMITGQFPGATEIERLYLFGGCHAKVVVYHVKGV
jgi:hypothetical protein